MVLGHSPLLGAGIPGHRRPVLRHRRVVRYSADRSLSAGTIRFCGGRVPVVAPRGGICLSTYNRPLSPVPPVQLKARHPGVPDPEGLFTKAPATLHELGTRLSSSIANHSPWMGTMTLDVRQDQASSRRDFLRKG